VRFNSSALTIPLSFSVQAEHKGFQYGSLSDLAARSDQRLS
jgi:hypothetical protein